MKRTLSGIAAYTKMLAAEIPEKTATYTPIKHSEIMVRMRQEIMAAGFVIAGEEYRSTTEGAVALGQVKMRFKSDPDLELCACFMNSYNKQVAFRFALGAMVKLTGNTIMLENDVHGFYKRVHTGAADLLAVGKIKELISGAEDYWNQLVDFKNDLKGQQWHNFDVNHVVGEHFLQQELVNTYQMSTIKDGLKPHRGGAVTAWDVYNVVGEALKDSHPSEWMQTHSASQKIFAEHLTMTTRHSTLVDPDSAVFPGEHPSNDGAEERDEEHPALKQLAATGFSLDA